MLILLETVDHLAEAYPACTAHTECLADVFIGDIDHWFFEEVTLAGVLLGTIQMIYGTECVKSYLVGYRVFKKLNASMGLADVLVCDIDHWFFEEVTLASVLLGTIQMVYGTGCVKSYLWESIRYRVFKKLHA